MNKEIAFRIEFDIPAYRILHQLQIHNTQVENQIEKGIELAFDELTEEDNFLILVKEAVKNEVYKVINYNLSYNIHGKILKALEEKIGKKLDEYSEQIAEKLSKTLAVKENE